MRFGMFARPLVKLFTLQSLNSKLNTSAASPQFWCKCSRAKIRVKNVNLPYCNILYTNICVYYKQNKNKPYCIYWFQTQEHQPPLVHLLVLVLHFSLSIPSRTVIAGNLHMKLYSNKLSAMFELYSMTKRAIIYIWDVFLI